MAAASPAAAAATVYGTQGNTKPAAPAAAPGVPGGIPPAALAGAAAAVAPQLPLASILGEFARSLPQQVGQPTPTSLAHQKTFLFILAFQAVMGTLGLIRLFDLLTFVATIFMLLLGHQAYRQYMHITYISAWGILCLVVGVCQVVGEIFPILMGVFTLKLGEAMVRVTIPMSSLLGAAFAWHLYVDYASQTNMHDFGLHNAVKDPFGNYLSHADYSKMNASGEVIQQAAQTNPPNHV